MLIIKYIYIHIYKKYDAIYFNIIHLLLLNSNVFNGLYLNNI